MIQGTYWLPTFMFTPYTFKFLPGMAQLLLWNFGPLWGLWIEKRQIQQIRMKFFPSYQPEFWFRLKDSNFYDPWNHWYSIVIIIVWSVTQLFYREVNVLLTFQEPHQTADSKSLWTIEHLWVRVKYLLEARLNSIKDDIKKLGRL